MEFKAGGDQGEGAARGPAGGRRGEGQWITDRRWYPYLAR